VVLQVSFCLPLGQFGRMLSWDSNAGGAMVCVYLLGCYDGAVWPWRLLHLTLKSLETGAISSEISCPGGGRLG